MQAIGSLIGVMFNTPVGHFIAAHASKIVIVALGALAALATYLRFRAQHSGHDLKNKRIDAPRETPKTSEPVKEVAASILDNAPKLTTQPFKSVTKERATIPAGTRKPPTRKPRKEALPSVPVAE
jgi:hypothetical protein